MIIEYAATEMVFLDDYSDADPNHKSIRGNGITTFLFHVSQCIIFNIINQVKTILIANVSLKTFYSRLGFSVIKDVATSTTSEAAMRQFHYETGKSKEDEIKPIGLHCLYTIPRRVKFLHDDRIKFNTQKNVFRYLDGISTSVNFFTNKFIDDETKKRVDKTRDKLASDKMAYDIKHYIHCLQHDHFWVRRIKNDTNKLLVNREYIDFFIRIYEQWRTYNRMKCLPHFDKWHCHNSRYILKPEKRLNVLCATTVT